MAGGSKTREYLAASAGRTRGRDSDGKENTTVEEECLEEKIKERKGTKEGTA